MNGIKRIDLAIDENILDMITGRVIVAGIISCDAE